MNTLTLHDVDKIEKRIRQVRDALDRVEHEARRILAYDSDVLLTQISHAQVWVALGTAGAAEELDRLRAQLLAIEQRRPECEHLMRPGEPDRIGRRGPSLLDKMRYRIGHAVNDLDHVQRLQGRLRELTAERAEVKGVGMKMDSVRHNLDERVEGVQQKIRDTLRQLQARLEADLILRPEPEEPVATEPAEKKTSSKSSTKAA